MSDRDIEVHSQRDRRSESRRSRSRRRRDDDTPRRRRTRSRSHERSIHRSRRRSRSIDSVRSLQLREHKLSEDRRKLKVLENEVRRQRDRLTNRREASQRSVTPRARPCEEPHLRVTRDRSLVTPIKRRLPTELDNDSETIPKKPRNTKSDLFEELLNVLKSKPGGSESFSSSSLNNVIPEFDPMLKEQTVNIWLDKVDECTEIYNWSDKQTIHYALPKLTGLAKTWYQGLPSIKHTWEEWKAMLRESFPATENYAELLTDMLNRRVRPGESCELYYFAKINLLNRCKIFGKQAVDCLLYGIDDRGVRLGAQAAKFDRPEDVLEFFKTIKSQNRNQVEYNRESNRDRRQNVSSVSGLPKMVADSNVSRNSSSGGNRGPIKCFNCQGIGHPSFRCPKPLLKCTTCNYIGHESSQCPKAKEMPKDKNVLEVSMSNDTNSKYKLTATINGHTAVCQVDLGSEATLIRKSDAQMMGLSWDHVDGPYLRGLGNIPYLPLGRSLTNVVVQGIQEKDVELLIVDDHLINCRVLLGHTFTERPTIKIIKTPSEVRFERMGPEADLKLPLRVTSDVTISPGEMKSVLVRSDTAHDGYIYVNGSVRGSAGREYYLLPGEYQVKGTSCHVLIQNVTTIPVELGGNTLVTRAKLIGSSKNIMRVANHNNPSAPIAPKFGEQQSTEQKRECHELLEKYKDCFSSGLHDLGFTTVTEMEIHLKDSSPVVYRPYRMAYSERKLVQDMVEDMMDHGIVRESNSPYASPIVLVRKKSGEKRLCVDYRALNSRTKRDHYPLPRIDDLLDQLSGQKLFTSLDLASGYHQIPIAEQSREKTAFVTPDGQFEYNRVPFGLANAPAVFQRAIHKILSKSKVNYVVIYMDDILIPSKSFQEGKERLEEVSGLLREAGLTLKMEKCQFFLEKIDFLGFEIGEWGIKPGSLKTEAVTRFPCPKNQHEVRRFLGLASFFRRFVKGFALIVRPLTSLLKKNTPWKWTQVEAGSFENIKRLLSERPILALYDHSAETQLHTDASKLGLAGILLQRKGSDPWRPVAYFSRSTQADEMKLHSFELETLAVICALNKFRPYLLGMEFTIVTDCNALRSTFTKRDLIPRISRWWIQFLEFDCKIEYRPGERMSHVDALSRGPVSAEPEKIHTLDILTITSEDWISTVQSSDEEIKRIKEVLEDPETQNISRMYKEYTVKNGRVFRVLPDETTRWVVPRDVRWQLLKANHDDVGHFGFEKTLERVRSQFWFPKMRKFIKKYVSACLECAHHKLPAGAKEGLLHPIPKVEIPFHTIHADHLGPFPRSRRGSSYILVTVDAFTKYVCLTPVRSTKSKESIRALRAQFSYFGSPTRLITDRGTSFTSKKFKVFVRSIGARHILNAVATPRANGQVERYNRTILAALGSMVHDKNKNLWEEYLPDVQLGINTTIHEVTRKTPTELLFGRTVTNPALGLLNNATDDVNTNKETIEDIRTDASERIKRKQEEMKTRYDEKRKVGRVYEEGDLVRIARAIVTGPGQSKKLEAKCKGPYRIKKILPNDRFLVEDTPLTRKGARYETIVSIDKIFPWLSYTAACSSSEVSDDESDPN